MSDCLTALKNARESELEVRAELEHIERLHRIMKIQERSENYARTVVEKLAALEKELNAAIDEAVDRKREALAYLSILTGSERAVLYQYYILAKEWQKIALELYISERQVFNIRKKALDRLSARQSRLSEDSRRSCETEEV